MGDIQSGEIGAIAQSDQFRRHCQSESEKRGSVGVRQKVVRPRKESQSRARGEESERRRRGEESRHHSEEKSGKDESEERSGRESRGGGKSEVGRGGKETTGRGRVQEKLGGAMDGKHRCENGKAHRKERGYHKVETRERVG